MAPTSVARLLAAALAVAVLASCSKDDPEPVAAGGAGIELASTTTEQPRITEPKPSTTTTTSSTTTTSTTTTSTTTTTTLPPGPTIDELVAALPGPDALPGGGWSRTEAPTEAGGAPGPLCAGSTVPTPLSGLLDEVSIADGVSARYDRADGRSSVQLVLAPLKDAAARVAQAETEVAGCAGGTAPVTPLAWPALGDRSTAYTRPATTDAEGRTWVLAHVGEVALGLSVTIFPADGVEAEPPPSDAQLQAFVQAALDGVRPPAQPGA